jgi:hypothetical protein
MQKNDHYWGLKKPFRILFMVFDRVQTFKNVFASVVASEVPPPKISFPTGDLWTNRGNRSSFDPPLTDISL